MQRLVNAFSVNVEGNPDGAMPHARAVQARLCEEDGR
jgi:hypothetical protein